MRGGRFEQQRGGGGNVRNAETLLQSRSMAEVREVEAATRKEIRDKQEELRQLVGASYRDLIDSADSIVIMGKCCECIVENLAAMSRGLDSISSSMEGLSSGDNRGREEQYAMGSRVKYLVDTPEKIWGCLDEHMYLEAAERFVRARLVRNLLLHTNAATTTHFPLLRQQALLDQELQKISPRARERLLDTALSPSDYAVALAAIAIMDQLSSTDLFGLFIGSRKAWLRNYLRSAADSPAAILCRAVDLIQLTLCHIGQLFLEVSNGSTPLLFATILTAPPSSQLFGGILDPESEVAAWKVHREKLESSMVPLSADFIAEQSLLFLEECARELSVESRPIFSGVLSGKELAALEEALRLHIDKQLVLHASLEWLYDAFGRAANSPWDFLSTLLLKRPVNLWATLLESIFMERVKAIVDSHVRGISILHMVDAHLKSIETSACFDQPRIGLARSRAAEDGRHSPMKNRDWLEDVRLYFGPEVCEIQEVVDQRLKTVLQDLLLSLATPQRFSSRITELAPFLHGRVMSCMTSIAGELEARLKTLTRSQGAGDSLVNVERALFLGRLAMSLGYHLRFLPLILGAPERWMDDAGAPETAVRDAGHVLLRRNSWSENRDGKSMIGVRSPKVDQASRLLSKLQAELSGQWDAAHHLWVSWSTDKLVQMFLSDLDADDSLSAAYKGWQQETQDNGEVKLPPTASPSAAGLLFAANQEIYRVGGHILDKPLVQLFATRLLEKVVSTYYTYLANGVSLSERGSLQLLLDVKFVSKVLMEEQKRSKSQSQVKVDALLSRLSTNLDPINWATYQAQLWENEQRSYQRSAVLFGFLTQLNRLHAEAGVRNPGAREDVNIMSLSKSVPRFSNLPISVPTVLGGVAGGAIAREAETADGVARGDEERYDDDDSRGLTSLVNARPLLKSLMGQVGSRIGEGTLKFGSSIIGDGQVGRLRDKSAAAISTFGDMLPALPSLDHAWS